MQSKRISSAVLAGTGLLAFPALAQDLDPGSRETLSDALVVTALKRNETIATVPAPVSVIGGETIHQSNVTTAESLADLSVSLTILPNPTANIIFLRGVGNFTLQPSSDPAIGWNYDGVFVGRPNGTQGQFYDLQRIEILKGPQGVLYGRNASGGTINLIPTQPRPGVTEGRVMASVATRDTFNAEGAINLALCSKGALRLSGQVLGQDSYLEGFAGSRQNAVRVQMKAELAPDVTVRVAGDYMHQGGVGQGTTYLGYYLYDGNTGAYRLIPSNFGLDAGNRSPSAQAFRQTVPLASLGRTLDAQAAVPYQNNALMGAHAEIIADLGFATLHLLPAWRYSDFDQNPPGAPFGYNYLEKIDQRSVEGRLSDHRGKLSWLLGGILFNEDIHSRYQLNFSNQLSLSDSRYGTRSRAVYANATWEALPRLRVVGGLRRSWDDKTLEAVNTAYNLVCNVRVAGRPACPNVPLLQLGSSPAAAGLPVPGVGTPLPIFVNGAPTGAVISRTDRIDTPRSASFATTTWRGGIEADIARAGVAYANIQKGYRPGGLNVATGFETYAPERLTAYTLGARWQNAGSSLALAAEAFWWDYRDQQISSIQPDFSTPPRNVNFTRNAGSSTIRGIEVDARVRPFRGSMIFANVQYLDARYESFSFLQVSPNVPPLTGCATSATTTAALYRVDCSGKRPLASPEWTLNVGARQTLAIGSLDLDLMASIRCVSSQNIGSAFLDSQTVAAHCTQDAQAFVHLAGRAIELSIFADNLTNRRVPTFVLFHPTSNLVVSTVSRPRTVGFRADIRF